MDEQNNQKLNSNSSQNQGDNVAPEVPGTDNGATNEGSNQTDNTAQSGAEQQYEEMKAENEADQHSDHKTFAIIGYILPFLFFLPLMNESSKDNVFARFHANQQLILLVLILGIYLLHNMIYMMFFMGGLFLMQLINLALIVFVILGVVNAAQGKMKELPLIGGFKLLK